MKLTMEISGHNSGQSTKRGTEELLTWSSVWGNDTNNRHAYARLYGNAAEALNAKLASLLSPGEVLSAKRFVISMEGEWKTSEVTRNGKTVKDRFFYTSTFEVLDGPALEGARLRRDAVSALRKAEELRKAGQLALAYEATAQFVANFAGVPLDLDEFIASSAAEEAEFGAVATGEHNPEALAAAHFAREDGVARTADASPEASEPAVNTDDAEPTARVADEPVEEEVQEFGPENDPELGAIGGTEDDIREEDAISVETALIQADNDVLDGRPAPQPQERKSIPPFAAKGPAPFVRPGAAMASSASPSASKPFDRPEIRREAPQPSARIAPAAEAASRPAPSSVPGFLRGR